MNNDEVSVSTIHDQTNARIYDRNIPSQVLQPYINARPVMTKYSHLPIVDPRKQNTVPLMQAPNFNPNHTFNPGNTKSPWSGFASAVNVESELRNQIYALQKCSVCSEQQERFVSGKHDAKTSDPTFAFVSGRTLL